MLRLAEVAALSDALDAWRLLARRRYALAARARMMMVQRHAELLGRP
jgi:hypothetical protein